MATAIPTFEPHPWLRGGHRQTIVGRYLLGGEAAPASEDRVLELPDGDRLRVADSIPSGWLAGDPAAVVIHGLAGDATSPYVVRLAAKLTRRGVRVARMNLRGAGAGFGLARKTYHGGLTGDVRAVVERLSADSPGSPIGLVGFSLGGNLALKLAAEAATEPVSGLDCVVSANAPLDLAACCRNIRRPSRRIYDRNFVGSLRTEIRRLHERFPELGPVDLGAIRSVFDFDELYTAPRHGFASAEEYYARSSAGPVLPQIRVPGLVVHSRDDPFIPSDTYDGLLFSDALALELIPTGGHLGYISRARWEGDRRWLETRLAVWLADRWAARLHDRPDRPERSALGPRHGGPNAHAQQSI